MNTILTEFKGNVEKFPILDGYFNIFLSVTDRTI